MNFNLTKKHSDRVWSSATGLKQNLFYKLLEQFEKSYLKIQGSAMKSRLMEGCSYCINNEEELLFFTLFSIKSGLTYDALGLVCGMDGSHAKRTQLLGIEILKHALSTLFHMPVRSFDEVTDFKEVFSDIEAVMIDVTEQPIQRSSNKEIQKEYYSGKKKRHTVKSLSIVDEYKNIKYLSMTFPGSKHDFSLMKQEFDPSKNWFEDKKVRIDLGFLGFEKLYVFKELEIPHKKPKLKKLTDEQKAENKCFSSARVVVENAFSGLKRFRILSDRLRLHDANLYDEILGVCAGLWNFIIS